SGAVVDARHLDSREPPVRDRCAGRLVRVLPFQLRSRGGFRQPLVHRVQALGRRLHLDRDGQRVVADPVHRGVRAALPPQVSARPGLPALDPRVPARRSPVVVVRGVRGRRCGGVRDPVPILLPDLHRGQRADARGTMVRVRGAGPRGHPRLLPGDLGAQGRPHAGARGSGMEATPRPRAGPRMIASSTESVPRIRDGLRESLWAFLGARLLLFAISVVGGGALALPPDQPPTDAGFPIPDLLPGWHMLFTATQRQDAAWFLRLASSGYARGDGSAAFFPLYPLAVRLVASLPALGPLGA